MRRRRSWRLPRLRQRQSADRRGGSDRRARRSWILLASCAPHLSTGWRSGLGKSQWQLCNEARSGKRRSCWWGQTLELWLETVTEIVIHKVVEKLYSYSAKYKFLYKLSFIVQTCKCFQYWPSGVWLCFWLPGKLSISVLLNLVSALQLADIFNDRLITNDQMIIIHFSHFQQNCKFHSIFPQFFVIFLSHMCQCYDFAWIRKYIFHEVTQPLNRHPYK